MTIFGTLLAATLLTSFAGLLAMLWSAGRGQLWVGARAARVVFSPGRGGSSEEGHIEDPAATAEQRRALGASLTGRRQAEAERILEPHELELRRVADRSSQRPVTLLLASATVWLLVGSAAGLMASIKLHEPDWLTEMAALTFGRIRPVHLNAVAYGWLSMSGMAAALW